MAVNLSPPEPAALLPVAGVDLGCAEAGIRKTGRAALMLMRFAAGTRVPGRGGAVAGTRGCAPAAVLPFSTGVILEPLPVERIEAALPRCRDALGAGNWVRAARGP